MEVPRSSMELCASASLALNSLDCHSRVVVFCNFFVQAVNLNDQAHLLIVLIFWHGALKGKTRIEVGAIDGASKTPCPSFGVD